MGSTTGIAWADETWNPFTFNCNKISEGCANCYAETLTERFKGGIFKGAPQWKGDAAWKSFKKIKSGSVVFAPSMTDAFHEGLPFRTIQHFFTMMESRPDVQFLVLTKRIERAWYMRHLLPWPKNIWLGASVEARKYLYRLEYLLDIPAAGHFTSVEPLLESLADTEFRVERHDGLQSICGWIASASTFCTRLKTGHGVRVCAEVGWIG